MMLSVWLSSTTAKKFHLPVRFLHQLTISLFTISTHETSFTKSGSSGSLNKNLLVSQPQESWQSWHHVVNLQCSYKAASI